MVDFTLFADYGGSFSDVTVKQTILQITSLSEIARREGLLALEDHFDRLPNRFLCELLQMVVDGTDPMRVIQIGETCAATLKENYANVLDVLALHLVRRMPDEELATCIDAYAFADNGGLARSILKEWPTVDKATLTGNLRMFARLAEFDEEAQRRHLFEILKQSCLRRQRQISQVTCQGAQAIQAGHNPRVVFQWLTAFTMEKIEVE